MILMLWKTFSALDLCHAGPTNSITGANHLSQMRNADEIPREKTLKQACAKAIDIAVKAGSILRETAEILEAEDVPLAYYPGNTNRVRIKAAGDLKA